MTAGPSLTSAVRDVLREDRDRNGIPDVLEPQQPRPPRPRTVAAHEPERRTASTPWVVGGGAVLTLAMVAAVVFLLSRETEGELSPPPKPFVTATATAEPAPTFTPPVVTTADPPPSAHTSTPVAVAPKPTNEQWGKRVVAGVNRKLKSCVEQDLLHTPGVPTGYTVTVTVGRDEMTSKVVFLTKPTAGFEACGSSAISRGFIDTKVHPSSPINEDFTFVVNIAFPDAKPATVADHTTGGWP